MRYFILICISAILFSCKTGQDKDKQKEKTAINPSEIEINKLPFYVEQKGDPRYAWQWSDQNGQNYILFSAIDPVSEGDHSSARIFAQHWYVKGNNYHRSWNIQPLVDSCEFDVTLNFIKESITITDLDKDDTAEVTFLYRRACRSDVSPSELVLLMNEGRDKKYALWGLGWIKASPEDSFTVTEQNADLETLPGYNKTEDEYMKTFGRYETEESFKSAPPAFLAYARKQWMKFVIESFE